MTVFQRRNYVLGILMHRMYMTCGNAPDYLKDNLKLKTHILRNLLIASLLLLYSRFR